MHSLIHTKQVLLKQKIEKNRILNNVNQLCNDYFDLYKKNYNSTNVRNEEKRGRGFKQFEIIDKGDQEPKSAKKKRTRQKNLRKYKNHYGLNLIKIILTH